MTVHNRGIVGAILMLALGAGAHAGEQAYPEDCFNSPEPQRNDLEPPPPGGSADADLFRVTDEDLKALLADLAAAEKRRASATAQRSN
jgi:hypothetical protein